MQRSVPARWAALVVLAGAVGCTGVPAAPPAVKTLTPVIEGHRVTLDVYATAQAPRGGAILSHGFTRSRRTLAGHAQALADAGVLVLTPDLPCTFDFRCNGRALAALVAQLRQGGVYGPPVERVMLVGFSAGGLSSLLAADAPGVVGYVGLDPFDRVFDRVVDRTASGESQRLGLTTAARLHTEALLLRAPPSSCNAGAVAADWASVLPVLWRDEVIPGATHCDFESPTDWICRLACGDTDPARQQRVRDSLLQAAQRWLH